ncbi:MAG TPA: trigger factor [Ilumatobacter sp.]|nr:trigger factor [Ilumatobacter sp.]
MKSSVEPLEGNKVKLYVEVDEAEFDRDIDRAFKVIAREVNLPGFRNGKAPRRLLEARIGLGPAREQALRDSIPQYLGKAVREHDVDLVDTPSIEITGGETDGIVEFEAECLVRPEIVVPGYNGLQIELDSPLPTEEEIDEAQATELRQSGSLADADRPAVTGDFLTLDLSATRDGEEVVGLNTEDWSYELGQGWVAEDFDSHLEGASAGDVLTFTTTPKGTEEAADFTVTVKSVQALQLPELTDEWVADNTGEFESIEHWRADIADQLQAGKLNQVRRTVGGKLANALAELVDAELPEPMVQAEVQNQFQQMARQLQSQGIDMNAFLSATGQDPQEMFQNFRPQAEQAVKTDLALRAVAKAEGLEVSDNDVEMEYARMAMQFGQKAKEIRRVYETNDAVPELLSQIRKQKAMDWLLHNVDMVDTAGNPIDRDLVLGHSDHDHDHDDHDHDHDHDDDEADDTEEAK